MGRFWVPACARTAYVRKRALLTLHRLQGSQPCSHPNPAPWAKVCNALLPFWLKGLASHNSPPARPGIVGSEAPAEGASPLPEGERGCVLALPGTLGVHGACTVHRACTGGGDPAVQVGLPAEETWSLSGGA